MTILHVITGLSVGGAERALYNLLGGELAADYKHVVLSLGDEGAYGSRIRALGVPVEMLDTRRGLPGPVIVSRLRRVLHRYQPDIIQGWMYHGNLAAWLARRLTTGKPALAWGVHHSLYDFSEEKRLTRQVIRVNCWLSGAPECVIYVSRLSREQHEKFGFSSKRSQVITIGFDLKSFRPDTAIARSVRTSLGIPYNAVVIGHVGRLHPMKDHARFVRAAGRVAQNDPDVHVLLIGRNVAPGNEKLSSLVLEDMKQRFHWLGEREDIPDLMRAMDMLCQSSWSEAFPNVLGEAMATGVPCVATDVGDSAYILGDTGVVVRPRDDDALFHGLMTMVDHSPESRQALGRAARARIEANFGLDVVVAQYADVYRRLCG